MAVDRIEDYDDTLKVILKPTDKFPVGMNYFYCDSSAEDIVNSHTWSLNQQRKTIAVIAHTTSINGYRSLLRFHQEYAYSILKHYPNYIDHINGLEIDNTDDNLNPVTVQQNGYNQPTKGYSFIPRSKHFRPRVAFNQETLVPYGVVHSELEACQLAYLAETDYLKSLMKKDEYYMYDFLKDRRQALDLLDLERTKQISPEEATYRHVMKYADNAWYYYRYNLADYFSQHHIPIPQYSLDTEGFMVHPITGEKLCPF